MTSEISRRISDVTVGLSVIGAGALVGASSVVPISNRQLLQGVVSVLALLATSLFVERISDSRHAVAQLSDLHDKMDGALSTLTGMQHGRLAEILTKRSSLPPFEARIDGAARVSVLGLSINTVAADYAGRMHAELEKGCELRFVFLDPESSAIAYASRTIKEVSSTNALRELATDTRDRLIEIARAYPGKVSVGLLLHEIPMHALIIAEFPNGNSVAYLELYVHDFVGRERPILPVRENVDPELYKMCVDEFDRLNAAATPVKIRSNGGRT